MIFEFLTVGLSIGARDQDIREKKAQTAVEEGRLSIEQASREQRVDPRAIAQRIRLTEIRGRAQNSGGKASRQQQAARGQSLFVTKLINEQRERQRTLPERVK